MTAVRIVSWSSDPARWLAPVFNLGDLRAHGWQRAQPPDRTCSTSERVIAPSRLMSTSSRTKCELFFIGADPRIWGR